MPDWERLVAERLAPLDIAPEARRDVIIEITAHLEEYYIARLREGAADAEAQTLAQVEDWIALCRKIRRSKEERMSFARKIVMPGLAATLVAVAALKLLVYLLIAPRPCGSGDLACVEILVSAEGPAYLPWLATLPFAGALAAAFARRMSARPIYRLVAALFPALYFFAEFIIGLADGFFWRIPVYWVVMPAIASVLGASLFLGDQGTSLPRRPGTRRERIPSQPPDSARYSERIASIGSTRDALRDGSSAAATPAPARMTIAVMNGAAANGLTP